jgi:hypothetical protein
MKSIYRIGLILFAFSVQISFGHLSAQDDCANEAIIHVYADVWGQEMQWSILDEEGNLVLESLPYPSAFSDTVVFCFEPGCYSLWLTDTFGDGWNGGMDINFPSTGEMLNGFTIDAGNFALFGFSVDAECEDIDWNGEDPTDDFDIWGCTDATASNFDPSATADDGSCFYPCADGIAASMLYVCTFSQGANVALEITDESGTIIYSGTDFSDVDIVYLDLCLGAGCFTANLSNSAGEGGWYGGYFYINNGNNQIAYASLPEDATEWSFDFSIDGSCGDVFGCTSEDALNYNPEATIDDGSCLAPCICDDAYEPVCGWVWETGEMVTFGNLCELNCAGAFIYWEGDCSEEPVYGCMDPEAMNYDPLATVDANCIYPLDCTGLNAVTITQSASADGFASTGFYLTDENGFFNAQLQYEDAFTSSACLEDGCYLLYTYNNGWDSTATTFTVSWADGIESFTTNPSQLGEIFALGINTDGCEYNASGCTDPFALNFDAYATEDDGSCMYPVECSDETTLASLYICTFSSGENVALTIADSEGNVVYDQQGYPNMTIEYLDICLDPTACYTATMSNLDDSTGGWYGGYFYINSQNVQVIYGALDNAAEASLDFSLSGECGEIFGCTDPAADNYDINATQDDGSCFYATDCSGLVTVTGLLTLGQWTEEIAWTLSDAAGMIVYEGSDYDGSGNGLSLFDFCVPAGCYTLELTDTFGDGWNQNILSLFWDGDGMDYTLETGDYISFDLGIGADCNDQPDPFAGCTDGGAINFDPNASEDDGSCEFAACPYNEVTFVTVTLEDGLSMGWNLDDENFDGSISGSQYENNSVHTHTACLVENCYTVNMWDWNADGWNGGWIEVWMDSTMLTTATMESGFNATMQLGIGMDCEDSDGGAAPFDFWDPIAFAPYPNPTEEIINVNGDGFDQHLPVLVDVKDMLGRTIWSKNIVPNDNPANWVISVEGWEAGMYFVSGMQGNRSAKAPFVVK